MEQSELKDKCDKLFAFINSDAANEVSPIHLDLLESQASAMVTYLHILTIRIKLLSAVDDADKEEAESQSEQEEE